MLRARPHASRTLLQRRGDARYTFTPSHINLKTALIEPLPPFAMAMPPPSTPVPHRAGVSISSKKGVLVLLVIVILLALFGRAPTAPPPPPTPTSPAR